MPNSQLQTFRKIAMAEGISYLMLFGISMPLKYLAEIRWPNQVIGMIHGILFILYFIYLYQLIKPMNWKFKEVFLLVAASVLPFGTFVADKKMLQEN